MHRRFLTFMFVAVFGTVALVVGVSGVGATDPAGRIVFSSTLPAYPLPESFDVSRIYSVGLDGQRTDLSGSRGSLSDELVSVSPDRSKIAFKRGEEWWLMNADGSGQRRLLSPGSGESLSDDASAIWSPDGTKLAIEVWWSCYPGPGDTCTDTGGSVIVDLAGNRLAEAGIVPTWSPGGKWLASEQGNIVSDATEVDYWLGISSITGPFNSIYGWIPLPDSVCLGPPIVWSPNGRWLATSTTGCEAGFAELDRSRLYLVPVAGGQTRGEARALPDASYPVWSPDGSRFAFARGDFLFLARGDGTRARLLGKLGGALSWSLGGQRLAFVSGHTLFVARGDGTDARPVAQNTFSLRWSPDGRSFAFLSGRTLFVARGDGTHTRALARRAGFPEWSPDGRSLAFVSGASGQVTVAAASGGRPRTLTSEPAGSQLQLLSWSQDHTHVLYTAKVVPGPHALWTVNPDGSRLTRLTSHEDRSPVWEPDGQRIAFVRGAAIYTIGPDGSGLKRLAGGPRERNYNPAWSPDGQRIAFIRSTTEYHTDLFIVNADGSGLRRLTKDGGAEVPAWSPDGSEIAYGDSFDGGIVLIHPDGTGKSTLVRNDSTEPAWSPDGSQIAYVQGDALWLAGAHGSNPHWIVTFTANDTHALSWSPDGKTIVYADAGHLYTTDTNGNNRTDLTPFRVPVDSRDPNWSHG